MGGEGRCLAAEVRPYSELAESLSSLRVGRWGRREEGGGRGKGRSSCREQWQDSLWGRDPLLCRGPGRPHHPPLTRQCMGGGAGKRSANLTQRRPPPHIPARNRAFTLQSALFPKLFTATQQARDCFHHLHLADAETEAGLAKLTAQGCSLPPVPSPGARHHHPTTQRLGSQRGTQGGMRTDVLGGTVGLHPFSPSQCQAVQDSPYPCSSAHHPVPYRHIPISAERLGCTPATHTPLSSRTHARASSCSSDPRTPSLAPHHQRAPPQN